MAVSEATLGPDHPDTALRLNNLARTLSDLGRHTEAVRALAVTEAALKPDHPGIAICLNNLDGIRAALEAVPEDEA
ncbi:tetratricopeptide repeat protein [Streptomyces sp. NPDC090493]|uniref:tetratricopeptide repeat protein n=1 Tax=Streptomyces sp. NPDC090493 TaxID=3365964 RepID=UPI00381CDA52